MRAAQPQVMDQLIGGGSEEPMVVDEYSSGLAPPDNFGSGARDNFPSAFQNNQGVGSQIGSQINFGATTSQADLDRAIAASMEDFGRGEGVANADMDEDA